MLAAPPPPSMTPDVCAGKVEGLPGARGRLLAKAEADTWPVELKSGQAEFGVVRFAPPHQQGQIGGGDSVKVLCGLTRSGGASGRGWPGPLHGESRSVMHGQVGIWAGAELGWAW